MSQKISRHLFLWKAMVFWKVEMPEYFLQDNPLQFYEVALKTFLKIPSCFPTCNATIKMQWVCSCWPLFPHIFQLAQMRKQVFWTQENYFSALGSLSVFPTFLAVCNTACHTWKWPQRWSVAGCCSGWSCMLGTGQAVPCSGEAAGEWYVGKERLCCMATAAPGALSKTYSQKWSGTRLSVNQSKPSLPEMVEQRRSCNDNI